MAWCSASRLLTIGSLKCWGRVWMPRGCWLFGTTRRLRLWRWPQITSRYSPAHCMGKTKTVTQSNIRVFVLENRVVVLLQVTTLFSTWYNNTWYIFIGSKCSLYSTFGQHIFASFLFYLACSARTIIAFCFAPSYTYHLGLVSLQQEHPCFGAVCRLAKRWLGAQLFSEDITEDTADLLVASLFLQPAPFTPPG